MPRSIITSSRGQNWERAALIKARACAGDLAAGEKLLRELAPFVWRKYLDFAAVADVHEMKRRIHAYRGHGEIAVEGHNVKLGRGGIREIEFFVQTQQLIAGGRHHALRGRGTLAMLARLAADGWIDDAARDELGAAYDFLRRVEHRLQMVADEQTHTLPAERAALDGFARFLGFAGRDEFAAALLAHLRAVERHYVRLFERPPAPPGEQQLSFLSPEGDGETLDRLAAMGFRQPREVAGAVHRWREGLYRGLRGEQTREILTAMAPAIVGEFAQAEAPDAAFVAFDRFLAGLRTGWRFVSLLRQHPELDPLSRFDPRRRAAARRHLGADAPRHRSAARAEFLRRLARRGPARRRTVPQARRDDELRGCARSEPAVRAGAHVPDRRAHPVGLGLGASRPANCSRGSPMSSSARCTRASADDFAATHGRVRGQETAILALGRLGAQEMTANSDLDLIVIYDYDKEHPDSDGARSLYGAQYFARFTQRLISALTVKTNYGALYPVDMRLRPSGRAGPLATQVDGFIGYQEREAWTWEHMALTRARVVSALAGFSRARRSRDPRRAHAARASRARSPRT